MDVAGLCAEKEEQKKEKKKKKKEEPSSMFQRQRVDLLLGELAKKYPPQFIPPPQPEVKGKVYILSLCAHWQEVKINCH